MIKPMSAVAGLVASFFTISNEAGEEELCFTVKQAGRFTREIHVLSRAKEVAGLSEEGHGVSFEKGRVTAEILGRHLRADQGLSEKRKVRL